MPRSRNKYSRAAIRSRSRRTRSQRSSRWFYATLAVIVGLGLVGVVLVRSGDEGSASPPQPAVGDQPGDHWHAGIAANVCGEWLGNPAQFQGVAGNPNVQAGLHTHSDGFVHIEPLFASEAGDNATLGKFLGYGGWRASAGSLELWAGPSFDPGTTEWSNGDRCPDADGNPGKGEPGRVVFEVNCKTVSGDPTDYKFADQDVIALGFLPKGERLGAPPNAGDVPGGGGAATERPGCAPSPEANPGVPATTPTTTPATPTPSSTP